MNNFRTGFGFDIHKFKKKRKLIIGGVVIPYKLGLDGHSDADVLLHAISDAMLGALGKPDIGQYFSDTDPKYKNISSIILLEEVNKIMQKEGFGIINLDCVIIADEPKINNFRDRIKKSIAQVLSLNPDCIGIKAKTTEGILSFSKKGIAAYCNILLERHK